MAGTDGSSEKKVLLLIADISGYTRFIAENQDSLTHSQIIISELMRAVLKEAKLPFKIAKLEGDAVFFYLEKAGNEALLTGMRDNLCDRLDRLFAAFHRRVTELAQSNTCPCAACRGIDMLQLKAVVHSGVALFYRLDRFMELSGVDVILVHRLLKNSVAIREYVLLTDAARADLAIPDGCMLKEGEETYEALGPIKTHLYVPRLPPDASGHRYDGWLSREKTKWIKTWGERFMRWGWWKIPAFRNLTVPGSPPSALPGDRQIVH